MKPTILAMAFAFGCVTASGAFAATLKCPPDSVKVGNSCIDTFEASVWKIPLENTAVLNKLQKGKVTLADLTAAGATQLGCSSAPFNHTAYPANFPSDGNWVPIAGSSPPSPGVYAVSIPGVLPTACTTWFQANEACALSGKRLVRNAEWQRAAAGTPDPGTDNGTTDCATDVTSASPASTGSRSNCKSSWGVFDMVGNVWEWVEDWTDRSNVGCTDWTSQTGVAGGDISCFGGDGSNPYSQIPGALLRGGSWTYGVSAGVFAVLSGDVPSFTRTDFGFRCAR
jgi:formylglycine-generating enzyme required for sulfatase activity